MISIFSCTDPEEAPQAFMRQLYERYARLMYSVASKCLPGDPHAREDMVQETVLKLTQKVALLQTMEEPSLAAYISVAVRNTAYSYLRKRATEEKNLLPWTDDIERVPSPAPSFEDKIISREQMERLWEVWQELPAEDRFLLEGRYILRYSDQELAAGLHCQSASVRMKLTRVRKKVLAQMQEKERIP